MNPTPITNGPESTLSPVGEQLEALHILSKECNRVKSRLTAKLEMVLPPSEPELDTHKSEPAAPKNHTGTCPLSQRLEAIVWDLQCELSEIDTLICAVQL